MAKTRDEITRRALQELEAVAGSEPVSAGDAEAIDCEAVAAMLAGERHVDLIGDVRGDVLPDEYFIPFSQLVAARHASVFGQSQQWSQTVEARALEAIRRITQRERPVMPVSTNPIGRPRFPW